MSRTKKNPGKSEKSQSWEYDFFALCKPIGHIDAFLLKKTHEKYYVNLIEWEMKIKTRKNV